MRDEYPFVYFMSAVVVPSIYWVITVEVGITESPADNEFTLSFGQVRLFRTSCVLRAWC